ncbi:MAG: polyphosphate kinase 1 [Flavobacteriales bacterium]|jgi:polyphosphate kinase|nr:MAG: polyphosphate kinase 1 [Flavobacteriales bacterium]
MATMDPALLEKARLHVRHWFARRMPRHMRFHDLEHTLAVARTAVALARARRMPPEEVSLLELAALFHDTGYALAYDGHERESARLAEAFLVKHGASARSRAQVRALVMATCFGARPRTAMQAVLRDADSAKAGQVDFAARSELLRAEREVAQGRRIGAQEWLRENLAYLGSHVFHTPEAQRRYGPQKRINLQRLREQAERHRAKAKSDREDRAEHRFVDRDLSWLSFNDRVLQEARDPRNPLLERVKFLGIYSSNLDEFYRVRVASLRSLGRLSKATRTALAVPPDRRIARINAKALAQQREFGRLWREELLPALARKGIRIRNEEQLSPAQMRFLREWTARRIAPRLVTAAVRAGNAPFVEDRKLYFACRLAPAGKSGGKQRLVLVNIPSDELGRFIALPAPKGRTELIFLDDAVRLALPGLFTGFRVLGCHAIKLSRDAELYLDEEFTGTVQDKVRKSLRKRITGVPSRLLYDAAMPRRMVRTLRELLGLAKDDLVPGGRYHHFSDLLRLPVAGHRALRDAPWPPLPHPALRARNAFAAADRADVLLHFPYHDFGQVTDWLRRAARDPAVRRIHITLYRVAEDSAVCTALIEALRRGKEVHAFVEVQARFDERSNLKWGEQLEQAGAVVNYGYEGLKVHCKLCLIERVVGGRMKRYAYLGTGNFNERTARLYADTALITANPTLTLEVSEVFRHLADRRHRPRTQQLMVAPLDLRAGLEELIDREIRSAALGRPSGILLKLNSLEDRALIAKLYDAAQAGVPIRLIVRGICCLVPGVRGLSEGIEVISIVDRYLEHSRTYVFHSEGRQRVYLASADWMGRNLDRRVEVAFPLQDAGLRAELLHLLDLQWEDGTKARTINKAQDNPYRKALRGRPVGHAQRDAYGYLRAKGKRAVR